MRYTIIVLLLIGCVCSADWLRVDDIYYNTNEIVNLQHYTYNSLQQYVSGYSPEGGERQNIGANELNNELYLRINDIANGTITKYERNQEGNVNRIVEVNPFTERNNSFFSLDEYAKDNTTEYGNNILSYFSSNHDITFNNEKPDDMFLNYPNYGNVFYQIGNKITQDGFGIEDIKNSQQTQQIRNEVANVETKMKGMFTTNYTNSVLNYDFSELGNYFIRVNHWTVNPFLNLKGQLKIKPDIGDMHYELWHKYFDRSYSNYALALKFALHTVMFLAFTIYVINDLMSIVNA